MFTNKIRLSSNRSIRKTKKIKVEQALTLMVMVALMMVLQDKNY